MCEGRRKWGEWGYVINPLSPLLPYGISLELFDGEGKINIAIGALLLLGHKFPPTYSLTLRRIKTLDADFFYSLEWRKLCQFLCLWLSIHYQLVYEGS